jgi:hypothetical protein
VAWLSYCWIEQPGIWLGRTLEKRAGHARLHVAADR